MCASAFARQLTSQCALLSYIQHAFACVYASTHPAGARVWNFAVSVDATLMHKLYRIYCLSFTHIKGRAHRRVLSSVVIIRRMECFLFECRDGCLEYAINGWTIFYADFTHLDAFFGYFEGERTATTRRHDTVEKVAVAQSHTHAVDKHLVSPRGSTDDQEHRQLNMKALNYCFWSI